MAAGYFELSCGVHEEIALIAWFLYNAASAQVHQVFLQSLLLDHKVFADQRCFLIRRGRNTVGLITLHRIKEVPLGEWATTTADVAFSASTLALAVSQTKIGAGYMNISEHSNGLPGAFQYRSPDVAVRFNLAPASSYEV